MANLDISSKLGHEKAKITIAEGKEYEVNCGAKTIIKAQDIFKKDDSLNGLFDAIEMLLGKKAKKDIYDMDLTVNELKIVITAIFAQVNESSYEEMEKRFQNK